MDGAVKITPLPAPTSIKKKKTNHRSKNQHRKTNQQKNGGISFSKFHH